MGMPGTLRAPGAAEIAPPPIMRPRDRAPPMRPPSNLPTSSRRRPSTHSTLLLSLLLAGRTMSFLTPNGHDTNDRAVHNFNCAPPQAGQPWSRYFVLTHHHPTEHHLYTSEYGGTRPPGGAADRRRGREAEKPQAASKPGLMWTWPNAARSS